MSEAETTTVEEDLAALESESAPAEETAEQVESPEPDAEVTEVVTEVEGETESKESRDKRIAGYYTERARANQLEQENAQLKQAQTQAQAPAVQAPEYDDFDTDAEFFAAVARHEATQAIEGYRTEQQQASSNASRVDALQQFAKKVAAANIPDYAAKANLLAETVGLKPDVLEALWSLEGDKGPKIVAYLADNLDIADGLTQVGLGELSAQLSATKPVQQTKAPPVVTPVKGTSVTGKSFDDPDAEFAFDEVKAMVNAIED